MRTAVLLLIALCAVNAQDDPTATPSPTAAPSGDMPPFDPIAATVEYQQFLASKYLDIILRFQHAQYETYAAMFFLQEGMANYQLTNPSGSSLEEDSVEDVKDFKLEEEDAQMPDPARFRLLASYFLLNSIHIKLYQIIIKAPEIQGEYYYNRVIQLSASMTGYQLPAPLLQTLYLNTFNSHMKTLKLAYALQYVSHFRTWLEDEIDVNAVVVAREPNFEMVALEQRGDLRQDRTFAFQSYSTLAMLDYQTFLLDMYIQYMFQMAFAQAQPAAPAAGPSAASFLEEGMEEQAQFFPFLAGAAMGSGMAQGNYMQVWTMWIRYYQLVMQFSAAQAGQYSVALEWYAENENAEDPSKLLQASSFSFTAFASSLMQEAHMQYILAIFEMYSLYGSAMAGAAQPSPGGPAFAK